jgi:hypothetical protein
LAEEGKKMFACKEEIVQGTRQCVHVTATSPKRSTTLATEREREREREREKNKKKKKKRKKGLVLLKTMEATRKR